MPPLKTGSGFERQSTLGAAPRSSGARSRLLGDRRGLPLPRHRGQSMRTCSAGLLGAATLMIAGGALAASGEEIYRAKCSFCHDSGAGLAPKLTDRAAWAARIAQGRDAMYAAALKGKPNTAMLAKGGYSGLSDADIKAVVDYMLREVGYADGGSGSETADRRQSAGEASRRSEGATAKPVDDQTVTARVAEALRTAIGPPGAKIETYDGVTTVRGVGVKIRTRDGAVTLSGTVENAEVIRRAEAIAQAVAGVKKVENKLISAAIFQWD